MQRATNPGHMTLLMAEEFPARARRNSLSHVAKSEHFAEDEQHHKAAVSIHRDQANWSTRRLFLGRHFTMVLHNRGHLMMVMKASFTFWNAIGRRDNLC